MNPRQKQLVLKTIQGKRHRSLFDVSDKRWLLCEAEMTWVPPAIYLAGEMDRVKRLMEDTTIDLEARRIKGGRTEHAATFAYQLTDVDLYRGHLYKGAVREPSVCEPELEEDSAEVVHLRDAAIASSMYGSLYFGHWMMDDLTRHMAAESTGQEVAMLWKPVWHQEGYRDVLGIRSRLLTRAHFDRVVMFDDFGQNSFKLRRYSELRAKIRSSVRGKGNERVFIRRSGGVPRPLVNQEEIETEMIARGFTILDPMQCTVEEIVDQLAGARLVVGVEGSHLCHALYAMSEWGTLCVLQPPTRFTCITKDFADCLGLQYAFMTGTEVEDGFVVETGRLNTLLDKLDGRPHVAKYPVYEASLTHGARQQYVARGRPALPQPAA